MKPAVVWGLGAAIALIVAPVAIGVAMPEGHVASRTVEYRASVAEVWARVSNIGDWGKWHPDIDTVTLVEERGGDPIWEQRWNGGDAFKAQVIAVEPPTRMETKIVDDSTFGGTWTWILEPTASGGCTLTITEDGEVYNPVFRLVGWAFMDYRAGMDAYHRALAQDLGESIELTD